MRLTKNTRNVGEYQRWRALPMRSMMALGALALMPPASIAAPNDFEVQASNVTALKVGDVFEKGAKLGVPAGGIVTLIDRTGGSVRTRDCAGVYEGPIENCPPAPSNPGKSVGGGTRGGVR
jgi:hypothetical protein